MTSLVACIEAPVADVLHDGRAEEVRVLEHEPELPPEVVLPEVADVDAVDRDRSAAHLVEAREEIDDGRLAGPRRADERDRLAGLRLERDVVEDERVWPVAKRDVVELHASADLRQRACRRGVVRLRRRVEELEHALGAGQRGLERVVEIRERPERLHEVLPVVDERRDDADAHEPLEREPAAQAREHDDEQVPEHRGQGHEEERVRVRVDPRAVDPLVLGAERGEHRLVAPEDGHDLLAADRLLHDAVERPEVLLQLREALAREHGDEAREPQHDRDDQEGSEREPAVEHEHRDEDADHREDACQERRDVLRDGRIDGVDVVREPAHQLAGRMALEEIHRQGLQVSEELPAEPLQGALRDAGHEPARDALEDVVRHERGEHQPGDAREAGGVVRRDEAVERDAHQVRTDEPEDRVRDDQGADDVEPHAKLAEVGREALERAARVLGSHDVADAVSHRPERIRGRLAHGPVSPLPSCES